MEPSAFTILDEGRPVQVDALTSGETVRVPAEAIKAALDWELKPQGFCRGHICMSHRGHGELVTPDGVDLAGFATLIRRPLALDAAEHVAAFGASVHERGQQLASLRAPDFTLPDLAGRPHSLSDYRGKRVLLVAHASW